MADRVVVVAPNWLGDAVMALPAVASVRRQWPSAHLAVAARASVAPLFTLVAGVDAVITLETTTGLGAVARWRRDAHRLASAGADTALLLPNSFVSAWIVAQAPIGERWGYAADLRARLLTRAVPRPRTLLHQADYYLALVEALGITPAPPYAQVQVRGAALEARTRLLEGHGLAAAAPFVAMAPGAAYGKAKQWPPERFAELAARIHAELGWRAVLVGTRSDAPVCAGIARDVQRREPGTPAPVDLSGQTDLPALAAVLASARAVVANDSGAMHLAGAVGAPVVALFGSTNEQQTTPLTAAPDAPRPRVITHAAWCRPCMLRECPIDHRCMRGITAHAVMASITDLVR
ncbi:MAG: lipopolysaccharide heptosyltransferase II [Vicinamibacterales bacterium]|nr:lipopolysaccharide heptosyltransferase II [Vicinamibacterales bacterium]